MWARPPGISPVFAAPGWMEQEPEDMWQGTVMALRKVLDKYDVDPSEIKGIGLSGQMHSSVFLDKDGKVIRPAILWNDTRTTKQCYEIESLVEAHTPGRSVQSRIGRLHGTKGFVAEGA